MRFLNCLWLLLFSAKLFSQSPVFMLSPQKHVAWVQKILITPDKQSIITFGEDKSICIWDVKTGQLLRKKWLDIGLGENGRFIDADISSKSGLVAIARINSEGKPVVNLIDLVSDRVLVTFEGFSHDLGWVRIDPRERYMLTAGAGNGRMNSETVRIWKIPRVQSTPQRISKAIAEAPLGSVHNISIFNNGDDVVATLISGNTHAFHIDHNPSAIPDLSLKEREVPADRLGHTAYSPTSGQFIAVTHQGRVTLIEDSGKVDLIRADRKGDSTTHQVAISPSGTFAIVTVDSNETLITEVYDLVKRQRVVAIRDWQIGASFLSDTTFVCQRINGFGIYNLVMNKWRLIKKFRQDNGYDLRYGPGEQILYDSLRQVFDFEKLELHPAGPLEAFSEAKMIYHDNRLRLNNREHVLTMNDRNYYLIPRNMAFRGVSFLNDGRVVTARVGFGGRSHSLLLYNVLKSRDEWIHQPESMFESLGPVFSIVPHPEIEKNVFASRDGLGVISLFDANGPSVEIFKSLFRLEPLAGLVLGKDGIAYALPGERYTGTLKKGDVIVSINRIRVEGQSQAIRLLEELDPSKPVAIEAIRGKGSVQSTEKLNTISLRMPLLSFSPLDNGEWLCWTPQGYYASSTNGERSGGWVINKGPNAFAEFHPIYDFKKQFYKPELVKLVALHGSMEKAVLEFNQTADQPLNVSSALSEKLPPSVAWVSPAKDTTSDRSRVRLVASVQSLSKVQSVKVLLNGRTILRRDQISVRQERDSPLHTVSFELDLVANDNTINLFVENEFGTTISMERTLKLKQGGADIERYKPNLYLLSVGVSQHSIPEYSLRYADNDAKGIEQVYKSQQGLLFKNVYTRTLLNDKATRAEILESFYWLEQNATQKDVVVIFMASHGLNDKDRFYILPYDGDPDKIRITGVDWSNFSDVLGNLPSKVLVFIDACHSGKLGANILAKRGDTDLFEAIRTLAREENGVVIMAASTGKESSLESPEWKHGAFTYALLEGLRDGKADLNEDGIVNIREIDYFVADRVKTLTKGMQHPTTQKPSIVSEFPMLMLRK